MTRYLGATLCFILFASVGHADDKLHSGWTMYHNVGYGFEISYPRDMNHDDAQRKHLSYIPVCASGNVVCFDYNGDEYEGTNFGAAALSINIVRAARSEEECSKIDTGQFPVKEARINGIQFHYGETGGAAASHAVWGPTYRTFHEKVCFELAVAITATSMGIYDPGQVKEFSDAKLMKELQDMVHTFRFVGHVADGAAWKVHHNPGCGGQFEYPDTSYVVAAIAYSNEKYHSSGFTCEDYFVHGGLHYTVGYKANVSSKNGFDAWLASAGYPDLGIAQVTTRFLHHVMYKAGPYYYVVGQTGAYILSVSDANGNVIDSSHDRVFSHLVKTFRPT